MRFHRGSPVSRSKPPITPVLLLVLSAAAHPAVRAQPIQQTGPSSEAAGSADAAARARQVLETQVAQAPAPDRYRACLALAGGGPHPCQKSVRPPGDGEGMSAAERLWATVASARAGDERDLERVRAAARELSGFGQGTIVDAARATPPALAVPLLGVAVATGTPDIRYLAIVALADLGDPAADGLLRPAAAADAPGREIALAALAGEGDSDALARLRRAMPDLAGRELLAAGNALVRQGDPEGVAMLRGLMTGPDQLLALEAAAGLARAGDEEGRRVLVREATSGGHWLQLRAIALLGRRGVGRPADLAPLLDHTSSEVRNAAAESLVRLEAAPPVRADGTNKGQP